MYEVTMSTEEIKSHPNPHEALEILRDRLINQIKADGKDPLHYITQATSNQEEHTLTMTAEFSEERKQHFIDHPL